jgi:hypothetical protein
MKKNKRDLVNTKQPSLGKTGNNLAEYWFLITIYMCVCVLEKWSKNRPLCEWRYIDEGLKRIFNIFICLLDNSINFMSVNCYRSPLRKIRSWVF